MPIHKNIRSIYKKQFIFSLICLALLLAFWHFSSFQHFLFPTKIPANQLGARLDHASDYACFEEITVHYTGYDFEKNGKVRGSYYYSLIGNECLFFLLKNNTCNHGQESLTLKGLRGFVSTKTSVQELLLDNLAKDLSWEKEPLENITKPYLIDEIHYHFFLHLITYSIFFIITIAVFFNGCFSLLYIAYPAFSPACGSLFRPKASFHRLAIAERELQNRCLVRGRSFFITRHFIIELTKEYTHILPFKNLVWVYESHTIYPPIGRNRKVRYTLTYHCKRKHAVHSVYHRRTEADTILSYLRDYYPEIINGYTPENQELFKNL